MKTRNRHTSGTDEDRKIKKRTGAPPISQDDGVVPAILPAYDDRVFKLLMTHGDAGPILKDVVETVIGRKVKSVFVRNNELPAEDILEKQERLDVNCVTDTGEQIDIEMQASRIEEKGDKHHTLLKRKSLFYLCDLHSSQGMKGKTYVELARTWQVTFCAYPVYPRDEKFFRSATMREDDGSVMTDDITMVIVELSKAADLAKKPVNDLTPLEMWTIFFGYANRPEYGEVMEAIFKKKKEVNMAGTLLKSISKDERERAHFRSRRMFQTDMEHNRLMAERRGEERVKKLEGKRRKEERKEAVKKLKSNGVSVDVIVESMNLTQDEIKTFGLHPEKIQVSASSTLNRKKEK